MMTNEEANKFAFDSFVTAFQPGNEHILDHYFAADLELHTHPASKNFNLSELKLRLPSIHEKYQQLKSEVKDLLVEGNRVAFRVEQHAFYVPNNEYVTMNVMNLYKLNDGKVKEWRLWFSQDKE